MAIRQCADGCPIDRQGQVGGVRIDLHCALARGVRRAQEVIAAHQVHDGLGLQKRLVVVEDVLLITGKSQQALGVEQVLVLDIRDVAEDPLGKGRHMAGVSEHVVEANLVDEGTVLLRLVAINDRSRRERIRRMRGDDHARAALRHPMVGRSQEIVHRSAVPTRISVVKNEVDIRRILAIRRINDWARGIGGTKNGCVRPGGRDARGLIPSAPEDNRRVVPVLIHHFAIDIVSVGRLRRAVGMAIFRPNHDAALVGQVVFQLRVRIMDQSNVIHAELGQVIPISRQLGRADRGGMILGLLMLAHAT